LKSCLRRMRPAVRYCVKPIPARICDFRKSSVMRGEVIMAYLKVLMGHTILDTTTLS
jgi:hypothetical protein